MDTKELERIEGYLSQTLSEEDNTLFEKELKKSDELADKTRMVAYILHSIRLVGIKNDNERIKKMYALSAGDGKRYIVSVAAMLAVILTFAAVVSVPVYRHVIKPVIEKVFTSAPSPRKQADTVLMTDTIAPLAVDSLEADTIIVDEQPDVVTPVVIKKKEEPVKPKPEIKDTVIEVKPDTVARKVVVQAPPVQPAAPVPANRIVTYNQLQNYQFGDVVAKREGKNVVCSFTMRNEVEDAEIQMHSARAKDGYDKNYLAKYCLLNGKSKRIVEKWKKGEEHIVTVTIVDIPLEVSEFKSISFSFQSAGDSLKQKSQSIILKVGEIN